MTSAGRRVFDATHATLSFVLTVPALWNQVAFFAVTSVAVIGLYIAYATPILLRRLDPDFRQGRWNLGRWSAPIGWVAVLWVGFIVVLFLLPQYAPGTFGDPTFNFAPITVVAVGLFALGSWVLGGRRRFMRDVPEGHDTLPADELLVD